MIAFIDLHLSKAAWCRMSYWRKKTFKEVDLEDFCYETGKQNQSLDRVLSGSTLSFPAAGQHQIKALPGSRLPSCCRAAEFLGTKGQHLT
jgi:hypothetical protein